MRFDDVAIPIGAAWSSPFVRWQGALAEVNSVDLASQVTKDGLARAGIPAAEATSLVLGMTIPQRECFYAATTLAGRIGAPGTTGPVISQACATSVACLNLAAATTADSAEATLVVTTDRTSNGPTLIYPSASAPGGSPQSENWVLDSFARDPWGETSMAATAEAVARENGIERAELDELTIVRHEQYSNALADDRVFQRAWMVPAVVPQGRRDPIVIEADDGVHPTTIDGLAKLRPSSPDGVVTLGGQTHPADGTAGMLVATSARARELSGGQGVAHILSTGFARVDKARMPMAPVPAARQALEHAGLELAGIDIIKTHNPFAVNDVYFAQVTGVEATSMNPFGCSLVYGHPQGPTGTRGIVELIHALRQRGGGTGLFTGCAAGDSGAAVVVRVED